MDDQFAIVEIDTLAVRYCGDSEREAAIALMPGTVHGMGVLASIATARAKDAARGILKAKSAMLLKGQTKQWA